MPNRILVRRTGALGDVISITPILHRLRIENPDAYIVVETRYDQVFIGHGWKNHDVDYVVHQASTDFDRIIDLDMVHERDRRSHPIDAYMKITFGDTKGDKTYILPLDESETTVKLNVDFNKRITFAMNKSWQNRTIPLHVWQGLAEKLIADGYVIIALGTHIDQVLSPDLKAIVYTYDRLNLYQQAMLIHQSRCFVAGPSGLYTLSGVTETPTVVFQTINRPEHIINYHHGKLGWNTTVLWADVPCRGCTEEEGPVTWMGCRVGDYRCLNTFTVEGAYQAVREAIAGDLRAKI